MKGFANREKAEKIQKILKYWQVTKKKEDMPLIDVCFIIAMYVQRNTPGLLYSVGCKAALNFKSSEALSCVLLHDEHEKKVLVSRVMAADDTTHVFFLENGKVRILDSQSQSDIVLESEIITMNSGNICESLFLIDSKKQAYEIKDKAPIKVTGLPDALEIKDISCSYQFTVFLSECGRAFGVGSNSNGRLGLPLKINRTEAPTEIMFSSQSDSDKDNVIIANIHASQDGYVALDSKQRPWIIGQKLVKYLQADYSSLDPCISILKAWYSPQIQIIQIQCGWAHVVALDTKGRVYWFGKFDGSMAPSNPSFLDPVSLPHRIKEIRSGLDSLASKDVRGEWYIWGCNSFSHITGLCGCEAVCKKIEMRDTILNPMRCEWQNLFDASRVIDLQLGYFATYVIVRSI